MTDQTNTPGQFRVAALRKIAERIKDSLPNDRNMSTDLLNISMESIAALSGNVDRVADRLEKLQTMAVVRAPLDADAVHKRKLTKGVETLQAYIDEREKLNGEIVGQKLHAIDQDIGGKVNLAPNEFASEIRSRFLSLNADKRYKLIDELIEANDGPSLAAVLTAPAMLTGLTQQQQTDFIQALYRRQAPAAMVARGSILACAQAAGTAMGAARIAVHEFAAEQCLADLDSPQRVAEFQAAQRAADEAAAAFGAV